MSRRNTERFLVKLHRKKEREDHVPVELALI